MVSYDFPASRIRSFLGSVKDIDVSDGFVRTKALGEELDFSACESSFAEFQEMAAALSEVPWDVLPHDTQESVLNGIRNTQTAFFAIAKFAATEGETRRDELATAFQQGLDEFKVNALPYAGYLLWKRSGVDRRAKALLQDIEETLASTKAAQDEVESKRADVDAVLDAARGAVAELGASREAEAFHEAANRYASLAKWWLVGSISSAIAMIVVGVAVLVYWNTDGDLGAAAIAQAVLGRAAVIAVLSYATVTAVRMYRSNAHLAVVNRHREDALKTFRTFVEGTDSDDTKNQILLAAAHAAFGQTATGLIGEKAESGSTLEVFEGLFGRSARES